MSREISEILLLLETQYFEHNIRHSTDSISNAFHKEHILYIDLEFTENIYDDSELFQVIGLQWTHYPN